MTGYFGTITKKEATEIGRKGGSANLEAVNKAWADKEKINKLRESGLSLLSISRKYGVSYSTIYRILKAQ